MEIKNTDLPGLYQAADTASLTGQKIYFTSLMSYLLLLIIAATVSFYFPTSKGGALTSAALFLLTLGVLIGLRVKRPDDTWYNGRAVAESVKTRAWRWMMQAEPYFDTESLERVSKEFINDLKAILKQNRSLSNAISTEASINDPITEKMRFVRSLPIEERLETYVNERVKNQATWYSQKAIFNKKKAQLWFWVSVFLHSAAILFLLIRIDDPAFKLPIEIVATAAGAVLTWLQAKKHNELHSSYSLAAHEIVLIKGEALAIKTEKELSEYILDSEAAFSREHTQWVARKND